MRIVVMSNQASMTQEDQDALLKNTMALLSAGEMSEEDLIKLDGYIVYAIWLHLNIGCEESTHWLMIDPRLKK